MGREDEVENPDDDASWVQFLADMGIEFGTIYDALDQAEPIAQPVGNEAVEVSTDPLESQDYIRQVGDQQLGADLLPYRTPLTVEVVQEVIVDVVTRPPAARPPSRPRPMTPN
jgi:hypothetical protein